MRENERILIKIVKNGILRIDKKGQVWKCKRSHKEFCGDFENCKPVLKGYKDEHGYIRLDMWFAKLRKTIRSQAHRIVWIFHNGDIPEGLQINHKNGKKNDNRLRNLELVTPAENTIHALTVLNRKCGNRTRGKDRRGVHSKLSEEDVKQILRLLAEGLSAKEVAEQFPVTSARINQLRRVG